MSPLPSIVSDQHHQLEVQYPRYRYVSANAYQGTMAMTMRRTVTRNETFCAFCAATTAPCHAVVVVVMHKSKNKQLEHRAVRVSSAQHRRDANQHRPTIDGRRVRLTPIRHTLAYLLRGYRCADRPPDFRGFLSFSSLERLDGRYLISYCSLSSCVHQEGQESVRHRLLLDQVLYRTCNSRACVGETVRSLPL